MRRAAVPNKPRIAKTQRFPAPTGGWIKNVNLATPDARMPNGQKVSGAAHLENWFPTATGIRMRGGTQNYNQIESGDTVTSLFTYVNGNNKKFFAATASGIFDTTTVVPQSYFVDQDGNRFISETKNKFIPKVSKIEAETIGGLTGGDWSSVQFATTGGVFLDLVNGSDEKLIYDGTSFYPINDEDLSALNYDTETGAFTEGLVVTGGTSGATATIVKVIDNGTTGTLWLGAIAGGPFQNDEAITDSSTGAAVADGTSTTLFGAFTGVATSELSRNWFYKNRLFYVQKNSLSAWYLPVDSVTGAATEFPMGGIFTLGGSLLFGAAWSIESGDGLSEQCAFFTTEGEVAVFSGNDPASASTWSKVGVYRIGKPMGPKAYMRAGGDLVTATDIGFIPLSVAVQRDIAALSPSAISYLIETAWNEAVAARASADWNCAVWPTKQMVIVALPTVSGEKPEMFVANARTGAWCMFSGLDVSCLALFDDRMFFGTAGGAIVEMEVTGADRSSPYTATVAALFDPFKAPSSLKTGLLARSSVRSPSEVQVKLSLQSDFDIDLPSPPDDISVVTGSVWGDAVWDQSTWNSARTKQTFREWQSVAGSGYALTVAAQITSGSSVPPDVEYIETELTYDMGDIAS